MEAIASNAIVDLATVKDYLAIPMEDTAADGVLIRGINIASNKIERFVRGYVKQQDITDQIYDGSGSSRLDVRCRPIISLKTPAVGDLQYRSDILSAWQTLETELTHILFYVDRPWFIELYDNTFPLGVQNVKLSAKAGYSDVPGVFREVCTEMVAEAWKLSGRGGSLLMLATQSVSNPQAGSTMTQYVTLAERHTKMLLPFVWYMP